MRKAGPACPPDSDQKTLCRPAGAHLQFLCFPQGSAALQSFSSHFRTGSGLSCWRALRRSVHRAANRLRNP